MGEKVSEYIETQTEYNDNDLFDVSAYLGVDSYESRKTLFSTLKEAIFPALSDVYTKDANDNIFYKGVTPTLGTSCSKNIFHKTGGAITLGNGAIGNIFEPTENTTNFVFGANLRNVTIKAGNYPSSPSAGTLTLTAGGYAFLYNKDYPSEIFVGANGAALHSYYDSANDRYVVTNLVTLVSINIGGGGTVTSVNAGTNISVTGTAAAPIINSLSDRYKTTSTTSNTIGNGSRTFTVDANLSYIPLQEILIVYDPSNHMHGTVTSYNSTTGQLIVDVKHHTGGPGPFTSWVINLDGVPIDAITGAGTANRLAYFTAAQVIDDVAAITASRALISDANGLPTHSATTSTELGYVSGVTGAIQTQINTKRKTIQSASLGTAVTGTTANTYCKGVEIPVGWFVDGDCPMCNAGVIKTGTAGTLAIRMYLNTTNNLSGSPILVGSVAGGVLAASTLGQNMQRALAIIQADGSGSGTRVTNTSANQVNDFSTRTAANTTLTPNFTTTTYYFIIALQNGSSADSSNCEFISIN
jgi:hypothetical protein